MNVRCCALACLLLCLLAGLLAPAGAHAIRASSPTAKLLVAKTAYASPAGSARPVRLVHARTPISGAPTVLAVIGHAEPGGKRWLRVRLPGRPNGLTGWIAADGTLAGSVRTYVHVSLGARRVTVFRDGRVWRRLPAIVGKRSTPTPTGVFFVTERVLQPAGSVLGPWVLALNGYSTVLQEFAGGPGQIALHGRGALQAPLGSAASFGCVRVRDRDSRWLARSVPAGTTVAITRTAKARAARAAARGPASGWLLAQVAARMLRAVVAAT